MSASGGGRTPSEAILLVGMMGAGKTTVGRALAEALGWPFFDSDELVEQASGQTVAEIFATDGEAAFRLAERRALVESIGTGERVIAVAGGAVLDAENRGTISASGRVVWLRAEDRSLLARLGDGRGRPLIEGRAAEVVPQLAAERERFYEEVADVVVDTDGVAPHEVVREVVDGLTQRVRVALDDRSYDVVVGPGCRLLVDEVLPEAARRVAIVTQAGIGVDCPTDRETEVFTIGDGEDHKTLRTIEEVCRGFTRFGLTRNDVVIGVGGGLVTDVAGFAAASYHRGLAVVHVATTLLGQVDAAIGGKTAVNLPEGKNLVGAFHQPLGVYCDTATLASLPEPEWRSGCGELAKYVFLGAPDLGASSLEQTVLACATIKADVVAHDERETTGLRAILNYGHTLAHALEATGFAEAAEGGSGVSLRHGEAVAIGIIFAGRLAHRLGRIDDERLQRHFQVVQSYGLPTELPAPDLSDILLPVMAHDKKATDGLTFVLDGPSGLELVSEVAAGDVVATLDAMEPATVAR